MSNDRIAHELALAYLSMYDKRDYESEGEFVRRYVNTKARIIEALPDEAGAHE